MSAPAGGPEAIVLDGVRVHVVTERACVEHVLAALAAGRGGWIVTPNLDHLRMLQREGPLTPCYAEADLVVADGMPLVWASRLQRTPLPERVAGSDLIWSLSRGAAAAGRSVYLLGGDPGTAEAAATALAARAPGLRVVGTHCPPHGSLDRPGAEQALVARLVEAAPDIVFVALGTPRQEALVRRIRAALPRAWWLGVGISFSFVSGRVRRAPPWARRAGLEWLHRLAQEPGKLARRYVTDLPYGCGLLLRAALAGLRPRRARD